MADDYISAAIYDRLKRIEAVAECATRGENSVLKMQYRKLLADDITPMVNALIYADIALARCGTERDRQTLADLLGIRLEADRG